MEGSKTLFCSLNFLWAHQGYLRNLYTITARALKNVRQPWSMLLDELKFQDFRFSGRLFSDVTSNSMVEGNHSLQCLIFDHLDVNVKY
jgi:hypothetical protein